MPGIVAAKPIFVLWDNGLGDGQQLADAVNYVQATVVPETIPRFTREHQQATGSRASGLELTQTASRLHHDENLLTNVRADMPGTCGRPISRCDLYDRR